jgi:hypothetical protein
MTPAGLDPLVRHQVYSALAASERAPSVSLLSQVLGVDVAAVRAALERLHADHALVRDGGTREVRMALPFSNVPTAYRVESAGRTWDANCAWDALGLVRLLGLRDAQVVDAGSPGRESRKLTVAEGQLVERDGVISFARPAWQWWDDIGFS